MLSTDSWPMDLTALYFPPAPPRAEASSTHKVALEVSYPKLPASDSLPAARDTSSPAKIAA